MSTPAAHQDKWVAASSFQGGLWFLEKVDPDSHAHVMSRTYRVTGPLDVAALRAAWFTILDRHRMLRTRFTERAGRVLACVGPADATAFVLGAATEPLRLAHGPQARLTVTPIAVGEYDVVISVHRAVADDESMSIMLAELSGRDFAMAVPPTVPLPVDGLIDWWRRALDPMPAPISLPTDRSRPARPSAEGAEIRFDWAFAANPATLLAGFAALLGRHSGRDRITVGMPCQVRPPGCANVVGPYRNLVVVPVDLAGRPSFATLVRRVTRSLADAVAHRALPFDQLVRALDVDRDPRRIPLCDIMFAPPGGDVRLSLPRVSVTRRPPERTSVAADLTLTIERGCPVAGSLAYRTCLFDRMSVARLLGQLRTLLDAALANPDLSIDLLPLDDRYRLRTIVHDGDRIAAALQDARPAHELCRARALRWPDAPAVAWQGRIVTYAELAANAAAVNALLPAAAGTPVAVRMATGPSQVAAVLGVLQSGAHVVCLHRGDTGERGRALLRSLRPGHVLVDQPVGTDPLALWYADELGGRVIDVSGVGTSDTRIAPTDMTGRAYVTYTSGSTGTPKVIPQSHATLAQFATWFARQFHIGPGVRVAQWTAPGYDASLCEMFAALVSGATLCPVPDRMRASPGLIVDWLAEHRVTIFQTVPSFARQLLAMLRRRGGAHRLRSLTHLLLAGEELAGELANGLRATLPHAQLVNLYGPTESVLATWHEITGPVHGSVPIGRPIPGRQVLVLDEADLPCPTGVTGEIVLRGPYLTSGYLGAAGDTAAFASLPARPEFGIAAGPCYRTGDLARLRWDGTLEFRGRKDFQVKINGIRVELGDIEAALTAHASVAECTVVAIPRANGTATRLCAYVVPRRGPSGAALGGADEWRNALRSRFGRAMPPVLLRTVIGLPRGSSGKVDRHRLPSPWAARAALRMPVTSVTNDVTAIWTTVLGDTPSDDFFAAGGHSLLALELLAAVRDRFGVTVALPDFLADPTIAGIRSLVEMTAIAPSA